MVAHELKSTRYEALLHCPGEHAPEALPEHPEGGMWPVSVGVDTITRWPAAAYWDGSVWCAEAYSEIDPHLTAEVRNLYTRTH